MGRFAKNPLVAHDPESAVIPSGTTGQRPTTPKVGSSRFNTSLSSFEIYDGANWRQLAAQGTVTLVVEDIGTGDGAHNSYTMGLAAPGDVEANVLVFVGNVHQNPLSAYTVTGTNITFGTNVPLNDHIIVYHGMNSTVIA